MALLKTESGPFSPPAAYVVPDLKQELVKAQRERRLQMGGFQLRLGLLQSINDSGILEQRTDNPTLYNIVIPGDINLIVGALSINSNKNDPDKNKMKVTLVDFQEDSPSDAVSLTLEASGQAYVSEPTGEEQTQLELKNEAIMIFAQSLYNAVVHSEMPEIPPSSKEEIKQRRRQIAFYDDAASTLIEFMKHFGEQSFPFVYAK